MAAVAVLPSRLSMTLRRVVHPESLDSLSPDEPSAVRSRQDLRRIHRAMGTRSIVVRALRRLAPVAQDAAGLRMLELGAGDGSLLLGVARSKLPSLQKVDVTLLDRQPLVSKATITAYAASGWTATAQVMDIFDWACRPVAACGRWDLVVANLFMHHFESSELALLLSAIASRCNRFLACEPRRSRLAWAGSHLVGAIGANAVTREDAVLSVHAGFSGSDLSSLWPADRADWQLDEYPAGLFSHCFTAQRLAHA
jgi:2-polyprenyl-3-methyl-5-hydroxy-6-metoxy-1,4-benzoquinol methylase